MTSKEAWLAAGQTERLPGGEAVFVADLGKGKPILLLHGFPTWSLDWRAAAQRLALHGRVIAPDFLGFGYSDKPRRRYTIAAQADLVLTVLATRGLHEVALVAVDYGVIVVQELMRRIQAKETILRISSVTLLNAAIVYSEYRPTRTQKILAMPVLGALFSWCVSRKAMRRALDAVSGRPMPDVAFDDLWLGIARQGGYRLGHPLIHYNAERTVHHRAWEEALGRLEAPLALVWGMADPVAGAHVLHEAKIAYPQAVVTELPGVGHYPQVEAPEAVAAAILTNARRG